MSANVSLNFRTSSYKSRVPRKISSAHQFRIVRIWNYSAVCLYPMVQVDSITWPSRLKVQVQESMIHWEVGSLQRPHPASSLQCLAFMQDRL